MGKTEMWNILKTADRMAKRTKKQFGTGGPIVQIC